MHGASVGDGAHDDWTIAPPPLARVEGEGRLEVHIRDGRVTQTRLHIFEPPRFFEALLRGRAYTEPPDITARICGICPVAYQMSALAAIEQICGVHVVGPAADRAASSTAANGSKATRCTSSCCTCPTSSAPTARWNWPGQTRGSSNGGSR